MRVLVTGANGFLGSVLVERLLCRGYDNVRCLVRKGSNFDKLEKLSCRFPGKVEYIFGTLCSLSDCIKLVDGIELVYHLAAATSGSAADMCQNTSVATSNLLKAISSQESKIKFVHCSSFSVYGVASLSKGAVVDENTPIEKMPEKRDLYSFVKLQQEQIVKKTCVEYAIPYAVLRPGVIYGPGGSAISSRVGLNLFSIFLHLGRKNKIPLTFVENCSESFVVVGEKGDFSGGVYNVVDDGIISSKEFLSLFRKKVKKIKYITLPYFALHFMAKLIKKYNVYSKGQLPDFLTPYKVASMWKRHQFSNEKIKATGWQQIVATSDGLERHFRYLLECNSVQK